MPLFPRYPAPPDEIVSTATALITAADHTDELAALVRMRAAAARQAVEGVLETPLAHASAHALESASEVSGSARFSAAVVALFAAAVQTYDAGVQGLNRRWELASATVEVDAAGSGRDALLRQLTHEHGLLDSALDDAANRAAALLRDGPGAETLALFPASGASGPSPALVELVALPPDEARRWWDTLSAAARRDLVSTYPEVIGRTDGLPADVRDEANRRLLARDLAVLTALPEADLSDGQCQQLANLRALESTLGRIESHADPLDGTPLPAQLYTYDPLAFGGDGRAAVVTGDLDAADHVAFLVSGLGTTVAGMTGHRPVNVYHESRWAGGGDSVAIVDWVGYDAPSWEQITDTAGVLNQDMARDGARLLADDVEGFRASRPDDVHVTVAGNSYGSSASAISADEFALDADDLVLTGSPGVGAADDADDLTTGRDHTWVGSASRDWVSTLGVTGTADPSQAAAGALGAVGFPTRDELMGNDPSEDEFDAHRFEAEHVDRLEGTFVDLDDPRDSAVGGWNIVDHNRYYDQSSESLYNVAAVVTGEYGQVQHAEYRFDPWYDGLRDPERDRVPEQMTHRPEGAADATP